MENNDITAGQLESLFRYFDGELTDEEEALLMQQLQQNKALQQAFDQQIMMYGLAGVSSVEQPSQTTLEPATIILGKVSAAIENRDAEKKPVPVALFNYRRAAVAAVVLSMVATLLYYYSQPRRPQKDLTIKTPGKDSLATVNPSHPFDSVARPNDPEPYNAIPYQQLYAANHTLFPSEALHVPVAALTYQDLYEQQRYKELAAKDKTDLDVKGQTDADEEKFILECFQFYKALGSMEANKLSQAAQLFSQLNDASSGNAQIRNAARWYLLLIYLKKEEKENAERMADTIANDTSNNYNKKAAFIKKALHN